jgi:predicted dehydrogenase
MNTDSKIRLGVVGAGQISSHHIKAALDNGFVLDSICAKDNSHRAQLLGSEFGFRKSCKTFEDFLNQEVDAYFVLTNTNVQVLIAHKLLSKEKPILIEKPVSLNPLEIKSLREADVNDNVVVGYNRRNYSSTKKLKSILNDLPTYAFQVNVPELASNANPKSKVIEQMILENSVHIFDLVFFLFGRPNSWKVRALNSDSNVFVRYVDWDYVNSRAGSMFVSIGVPDNWSISVYAPGNRFVLSPLEVFTHYSEIELVAANSKRPNRLYVPKTSQAWSPDEVDVRLKAGFHSQMKDFRNFILSRSRPETLASLSECEFVTSFAQEVLAGESHHH